MRVITFIMGIIMGVFSMSNIFAQSSITNSTKTKKTLMASCRLNTQNVSVVATLIPSQSSFPTPDMYTNTVTTQISF